MTRLFTFGLLALAASALAAPDRECRVLDCNQAELSALCGRPINFTCPVPVCPEPVCPVPVCSVSCPPAPPAPTVKAESCRLIRRGVNTGRLLCRRVTIE